MIGDLWKVIVVTTNNGNVSQDSHFFMTEKEAVEFYNKCNLETLSYALKPVKIR